MLKLLQPVEGYWKTLACLLLKEELQCTIKTIESDCFHDEYALDDTLKMWLSSTAVVKQSWETLCYTAKKYGDESLEIYMVKNDHKSKFEYVKCTYVARYVCVVESHKVVCYSLSQIENS